MALVLKVILGWDIHISIWVSSITVAVYVALGGLRSAIFNEVLQFILIWAGALLIPILGLIDAGGPAGLRARVIQNAGEAYTHLWGTLGSFDANPMAEYGAPTLRVINGGGIPQNNPVLNQVYANVLGRPVLVPSSKVTGIGSAIFAFLAAGTFRTIDDAQKRVCPAHITFTPNPAQQKVYNEIFPLYRDLYFAFGKPQAEFGNVLPRLIKIANAQREAS